MQDPAAHPSRSNVRTRPTTVSLPHELLRRLDAACRDRQANRSELVRKALAEFLDESALDRR